MKKHFIFISLFVLLGCINTNAQSSKLKYLLLEIYTDSSFISLDTIKHSVDFYLLKRNTKQEIKALPEQIFSLRKIPKIKSLLLKIDNREFSISVKRVQSKFAVLKIYINGNVVDNRADLRIKNGDVIYKLASCTECHKIEVIQLPIIVGSDGSPTTGYKGLNDYLFK
jgi:hypothetical protein